MAKLNKHTVIPLKVLTIDHEGIHLTVKATINGKVAYLIIDTGASRSVFDVAEINKYFKDKTKVNHTDSETLSSGLGTSTMPSKIALLNKVQIGDVILKNYEAILLDLSHVNKVYTQAGLKAIDGVIGNDILMKHKALIDYEKLEIKLKF